MWHIKLLRPGNDRGTGQGDRDLPGPGSLRRQRPQCRRNDHHRTPPPPRHSPRNPPGRDT